MSRNGTPLRKRKVGDLVAILAEDARALLRQEVELAKAELNERVGSLRADLARDVADAKDQIASGTSRIGGGAAMLAAAAAFALVTLGLVAALAVRALDHAMPLGGALVVTLAAFALATATLGVMARNRLRSAVPRALPWTVRQIRANAQRAFADNPIEQTTETLKEDVEWLKHPTRSGTQ